MCVCLFCIISNYYNKKYTFNSLKIQQMHFKYISTFIKNIIKRLICADIVIIFFTVTSNAVNLLICYEYEKIYM